LSADGTAMEILRRVEREAAANPGAELLVTAAPDVVAWLRQYEEETRRALTHFGAGRVRFEATKGPIGEFDVVCRQ
jgi:Ribonuclease G/E